MYTGLVHLHSVLRYVVVLLLIITIVDNGLRMYKSFNNNDNKLSLFTLISMHIQLLLGLGLWVVNLKDALAANAHIMKEPGYRFFIVEHFLGMVLAVVLVTVGYSKAKRQDVKWEKHRLIFFYYLIAFILVMAMIPWPFRESLGRGWF